MTEQQQRDRVEISWVQVSASALAAVSSAVLLSTVGVAGTLIGAAIGSVVATVGNAIYSHYLSVSRARVAAAQAVALERLTSARSGASGAWADSRRADNPGRTMRFRAERAADDLDDAEEQLDTAVEEVPRPSWREAVSGLRWKRIAAVAGGIFVVAMLVIVSFELLTGRAVSSYTGGSDSGSRTSVPGLGGRHSSGTPDDTPTPTKQPSTGESSTAPSSTPTPAEQQTPGETPSSSPSETPSTVPPTPEPSEQATLVPTPTAGETPAG